MQVDRIDPEQAFRAGLLGLPLHAALAPRGLAEAQAGFAHGPNEETALATRRLPGLRDPQAAFETGRALRFIARLFDRAGAPERVGRQFRDNLAAAILTHHMRHTGRPWRVEDTVEMFVELYGRVLGGADVEIVRRRILEHARHLPEPTTPPASRARSRLMRVLRGSRAASF
ncbi:MAG TPA: hypothetical protein ENJ83_04325 [Rhodospirillales bacterium]|nr:hypothetical protein [Rhodospirillales bacterium]